MLEQMEADSDIVTTDDIYEPLKAAYGAIETVPAVAPEARRG